MWLVIALGVVAGGATWFIVVPASREILLKLGTLVDMARRANPQEFATRIEPINPFVGGRFVHKRVTGMLRADMTAFGEICQRVQSDARKLDRRAHIGLLPVAVYVIGLGVWWFAFRPR